MSPVLSVLSTAIIRKVFISIVVVFNPGLWDFTLRAGKKLCSHKTTISNARAYSRAIIITAVKSFIVQGFDNSFTLS
jgi:hypothetical protein